MKKMMKMSSASSAVLSPQCLAQPPEQISNRYNRPLPTGSKNPRFQNEAGAQLFLVKISFIHDFHIQG